MKKHVKKSSRLTVQRIRTASDDELVQALSEMLQRRFPPELQRDKRSFLAALRSAPPGLRAMASVFDLDVSMTLDSLAWHFGNHNDERLLRETTAGLKLLGMNEASELFAAAWKIMKPSLAKIRNGVEDFADFLEKSGLERKVEPLDVRLRKIIEECGDLGLLHCWVAYAREHPGNCV